VTDDQPEEPERGRDPGGEPCRNPWPAPGREQGREQGREPDPDLGPEGERRGRDGPRGLARLPGLRRVTAAGFARGMAGAALLIAGITIVARVVGFARNLVFSGTVGTDCLATAYFTGNQVTNIVFEIVAGGALAGMVVPVLAGPVERRSPEAGRIASALVTWTVLILTPVSLLAALLARPLMSLLAQGVGGCDRGQVVEVGTRMLVVFAPQILLYGLAVVLYGVVQAHRRFLAPALAPLVSSLIVIGAYLSFVVTGSQYRAAVAAGQDDLSRLARAGELTLSLGTTCGVLAMVLTVGWPVARLRLRLRPALSFPSGVGERVRRLALAGVSALIAQQAAWTVVIILANQQGGGGTLAVYNYAWALFQLPYAVLAVPLATSAFPELSARAEEADGAAFDRTSAATTRAVVLLSCAGAAVLAAASLPVARVFLLDRLGGVPPERLAEAILAFAPGLVGYGLLAHAGRALYACGRGRASAAGQVTGWLAVIAAEVALAVPAEPGDVVAALGLGNTAGLTVGGALLLVLLARARGRAALAGLGRALLAGVLGGLAGYGVGALVAAGLDRAGFVPGLGAAGPYGNAVTAVLAALAAAAAFLLVAALIDRQDLRAVLRRSRRGST
jgi:murein biosynthesis integral membrane protein MurJ